MCVGANGNPKGSCQAKVRELDIALGIDEEVLGLQVPVKNPVRVAEGQALQQLEEVTLGTQALINHLKASVLGKNPSMESIQLWFQRRENCPPDSRAHLNQWQRDPGH